MHSASTFRTMLGMFPYETQDATECFLNANNLNAAVKKIIKLDSSNDPKTVRFCKALKVALKSPKDSAISAFVEKALEDYEVYLFSVLRNAYAQLIDPILEEVITEYADSFNETYSIDPMSGEITVLNESEFKKLGGDAISALGEKVEAADLPSNGFMKSTVVYSLFDYAVLEALKERLTPDA